MVKRVSARVKKIWAGLALLSVEMTIVVSLFVCALVAFIFITRRIFFLHRTAFDFRVFNYLDDHVSARNNEVIFLFTIFVLQKVFIPLNVALIAYFIEKENRKSFPG